MTALNLTARNLKVFGRNRIRRMMILNASGKKERGKMNRHGRILMNPGRGHMKDITANRKRIIKNRQQDNTDYGRQQNNGTAGYKKDELHDALSFYGLSIPFTQDQLREKRRKLMKTAHPDEGGNTEAAADINRYFDILKKYAN